MGSGGAGRGAGPGGDRPHGPDLGCMASSDLGLLFSRLRSEESIGEASAAPHA